MAIMRSEVEWETGDTTVVQVSAADKEKSEEIR